MVIEGSKVAIIADIHGNLQALKATLADIQTWQPDYLIINGDNVNRGPDSFNVIKCLTSYQKENNHKINIQWTLGNHDDLIYKWHTQHDDLPSEWFTDDFWSSLNWQTRQLTQPQENLAHCLHSLPMTYTLSLPQAPRLLFSHGSPRHYREGYSRIIGDSDLAEITTEHKADIFIGSHTHIPLVRYSPKLEPHKKPSPQHLFVNTGAVGVPFNRDARAQYLRLWLEPTPEDQTFTFQQEPFAATIPAKDIHETMPPQGSSTQLPLQLPNHKKTWYADFRAVPYDKTTALAAYEKDTYLDQGGLSAQIFFTEFQHTHPYYARYWKWTEQQGKPKTWKSWKMFIDTHEYVRKFEERPLPQAQPIQGINQEPLVIP